MQNDDLLYNNSLFQSICDQSQTRSIEDSLLNPIYAEDIEELFENSQKREIKRTFKKMPKKNTLQRELEGFKINSGRTLETIDRIVGNSLNESGISQYSFNGLDSQIDYKFMNSIIYQ